jgi:hypothetical protein
MVFYSQKKTEYEVVFLASYSADDLLPAMEFVMVRGMVTNLGVEIRIIKDFIHPGNFSA